MMDSYAPCPFCRQYSHSIGCDAVAAAFNHFQSMNAHPVRGHPMGHAFDEQTRDAAQVLMAAARSPDARNEAIKEAVKALEADAKLCDCFAYSEDECACGAWCEWKSITSARAVEIVRALIKDQANAE